MGLREQLGGAIQELHGVLARTELASVCGREVSVIVPAIVSTKSVADAAFWANGQAMFHVLKEDLNGFTVDTLNGQPINFGRRTLRIGNVSDNGIHFAFTLEGVNKG